VPPKDLAADTPVPEPAADSPAPAKAKREPIYVEEPNGRELIAAALRKAQRDHKHVLIEWGGNWCGWCYKLHDVFHNDAEVHPLVHEEFELVLIDSRTNDDLMHEYGGKDRQYSYPHLTVLNEQGEVLTNQETGSLEEGPKHDPKLVSQFLRTWMPAKVDAEQWLADSLVKAADEDKSVLIRVGTPYCGWCTVLAQFVQDHEALLATDYVDIKIDTQRMTNGEQVAARFEPQQSGGVPWMVIVDASGKELTSSFGPDGNIGYPYQPGEIAHFMTMLRETRKRLSDADLAAIEADLNAYREKREVKGL
jgi:thioredoxin-related protein